MAFVPLFCQSHHSPHGVASAADLARRARALGHTTLGLCDEATTAGFHAFDAACRVQGIRPVFGCRLPVAGFSLTGRVFSLALMVETEQGYRNLVRLLTMHHRRGEGDRQSLSAEDLRGRTAGLTAIIPFDGELNALLQGGEKHVVERYLQLAHGLFWPGLALGLEPPTAENAESCGMIVELARFIKVAAMATTTVRYPEPGDDAAAVFLRTPRQAPGRSYQPPRDLKTLPALWPETQVLAAWRGPWEACAHATGELARRCTWRPGRLRRAFPSLDLERGFDLNSYLFDQVIRGATQRYGQISEALKQRINREMDDLRSQNLAPYLLLCQQIAAALDERGISRGMGRGRLVASVLAYSLGISRIDPLQYNLVSKSLLGENETTPAIQVEIPRMATPVLLDWLRESFGDGHLAEIGRLQEVRRDQMVGEIAAWACMTEEEAELARREKKGLRSAGAAQRLSEMAEGRRARRWRDAAFVGDLAARLSPRPRAWQASGDRYVLAGEPLDAVVPLVRSAQDRPVTGLEEAAIDRLGLARLTFVPHSLLDILDQAMHAARAQHPAAPEFGRIPLDDRPTFELLGRGDTAGIPPLENITARCLLRKHEPRNLLQLLRVKTEAATGRADAGPQELSAELPDVLLSYQCAYLKTNYPLAFYVAAISAAIGRENPAPLVRAARRAGYELIAPDINLSEWETTIQTDAIRLGLAAVKGFGVRAWEHLKSVRSGGAFETLHEFCERVDTRLINLRTLRMLIASGAMDRLARNRASMDAVIAQYQKKARELEEIRGGPDQATLFDLEAWEEGETPAGETAMPDLEEWNDWDRHQREYEALGFHLSLDPIRRFHIALEHLRPLQIDEITPALAGRTVRAAGLVVAVEEEGPLIAEPGQKVVNLEGLPVHLTAPLAAVSGDCLQPACEALVIGRLERTGGELRLIADGIWRLADLEDQATKVSRLRLGLVGENRATLKLLLDLVRQFPGSTQLDLAEYPQGRGWTWHRLVRQRVFFCSPLYQGLARILPGEAIEIFGNDGDRLQVKLPVAAAAEDKDLPKDELGIDSPPKPDEEPEDAAADATDDEESEESPVETNGKPAGEDADSANGNEEKNEETARSATESDPREED
jgi:DNA polymerase III alpha subunit